LAILTTFVAEEGRLKLVDRFLFVSMGLVVFTSGCAFGTTKTVNGATYELSGAETVLAERMEAEDPKSASIEVRCNYWKQKRAELNADPRTLTRRAGVISTNRYEGVRGWAGQLEQIACGAVAEKRAKDEANRREQAKQEAAERDAAQRAAAAKEAADSLQAWRAACSEGPGDPCVKAAGRACLLSKDAEPCAVVTKAKEEKAAVAAAERAERDRVAAVERAEREKVIAKKTAECNKNMAESCYELGDKLGHGIPFLKRSCELKYQAGCVAYAAAELERARAHERAEAQAAAQAAKRGAEGASRAVAAARGPKRSLQNPADMAALQQSSQGYKASLFACVSDVKSCINKAPSYFPPPSIPNKQAWVNENCNPQYQACQDKCEADMNRQGWCVSHSVITGERSGGSVGPCP